MARTEKSVKLHWVAEYKDGSTKTENDCSYSSLPRENLIAFGLFTLENKPVSLLQLSSSKVLFYRMRVVLDVSGGSSERVYLLGCRQKTGEQHLTVVDSDGKVASYKDFKEANMSSIEFYPQEQT